MQLGDATSSPDTGFSWGNLLNSLGTAVGSAANYALQYKQAQLSAQTQQAQIAAQTAQARAAAQAQAQAQSMARLNTGFPNIGLPSALPGLPGYASNISASTNYLPLILIGVFGIGAAAILMRD